MKPHEHALAFLRTARGREALLEGWHVSVDMLIQERARAGDQTPWPDAETCEALRRRNLHTLDQLRAQAREAAREAARDPARRAMAQALAGAAEAVIRRRRRLYEMMRRHHPLPATPAWDTAEERA